MTSEFFDEQTQESRVKATIVSKYFRAWAKVMIAVQKKWKTTNDRIGYIDLFCGPGRYRDGGRSTPLLILESAIADQDLRGRLVTIFNDEDANHAAALKGEISQLPGIATLKYPPRVEHRSVDEALARGLQDLRLIPALVFVDPWGYRGLSLQLIQGVLKDWGCECIFFSTTTASTWALPMTLCNLTWRRYSGEPVERPRCGSDWRD